LAGLADGSARAEIDPLPAAARAAVDLFPASEHVIDACRRVQAQTRGIVLCPTRLPRSFLSDVGLPPPALHARPTGGGGPATGVDVGYGGPWEPPAPHWRERLWRNRPCCFLHFEVYQRSDRRKAIPRGRRLWRGAAAS
jgi:hypothetical protein